MGVCYDFICMTCKKRIELDKNRTLGHLWASHSIEALDREPHPYDLVQPLLFMKRHWGHVIELISDCSDEYYDYQNYENERP